LEAEKWLDHISGVGDLHKWPVSVRLEAARSSLIDAASNWYACKTFVNWDDFVHKFRRTFIGRSNVLEAWKAMDARTQGKGESVMTYFHDKVRLCTCLNLSFRETKDAIIEGLWSQELCQHLLATQQMDLDGVLEEIRNYERINSARMSRFSMREPSFSSGIVLPPASQPSKTKPATIKCFNCNEAGHLSSACLKSKRTFGSCFLCGGLDHIKQDCPKRIVKSEQPASREATVLLLQCPPSSPVSSLMAPINIEELDHAKQDSTKKTLESELLKSPPSSPVPSYMVPVKIDEEISVEAVLDSGSPISIVKREFVPTCISALSETSESYFGFNGSKLTILGYILHKLKINDIFIKIKLYVVHNDAMNFDCILGRDFISHPEIVVNLGSHLSICHRNVVRAKKKKIIKILVDRVDHFVRMVEL
jgi:hypothetical protein